MIVKKFKKGRGNQPGVVQVKLKNLRDGNVVLNVVDAFGERISQGSILIVSSDGVSLIGSFSPDVGLPLTPKTETVVTRT